MNLKELDRISIHLQYVQKSLIPPLSASDVSSTCMHEIIGVHPWAHEQGSEDAVIRCTDVVSTGGKISTADGFGTHVRIGCALQLGQLIQEHIR